MTDGGDELLDREIHARGPTPLWEVVLALACVAIAIGAFLAKSATGMLFAVLPAAMLVALFIYRERSVRLRLTAAEILREPSGETVPYEAIHDIVAKDSNARQIHQGGPYSLEIVHEQGTLRIPQRQNVASQELHRFLLARIPPPALRELNPELEPYYQRQTEKHGAGNVWTFAARAFVARSSVRRRLQAVSIAMLLVGLLWVVAGAAIKDGATSGFGLMPIILGALFLLFARARATNPIKGIKNWERSCLVVSPEGLALIQGDLRGELRWHELQDVKMSGQQSFRVSNAVPAGLMLRVAGAAIVIRDIYDAPLTAILAKIQTYRG